MHMTANFTASTHAATFCCRYIKKKIRTANDKATHRPPHIHTEKPIPENTGKAPHVHSTKPRKTIMTPECNFIEKDSL